MPVDTLIADAQPTAGSNLNGRYDAVRSTTHALVAPLSPEDCVVQSMPDASPAKWHLAHTTWFFETFLLAPNLSGYRAFHPQFSFLFNSYYNSIGERHPRAQRGLLTRPSLDEILAYRAHVDRGMHKLLAKSLSAETAALVDVGLNHEQQHQELLLTDVKHLLSCSPIRPSYREPLPASSTTPPKARFVAFEAGVRLCGFGEDGFCYDNEQPRHRQYLHSFAIADRLVTNGEWQAFMDDGGYARPEFWLSDGWYCITSNGWNAPMYWERIDDAGQSFTLTGMRPVDPTEPVCHVSFYEADAFARWSGKRLPTEFEWEVASEGCPIEGNFLDSSRFHPSAVGGGSEPAGSPGHLRQLYGDVWQWTASPYVAYPGYKPPAGALGEYNGKFMSNQMVLRGGSCATPHSHIRPTYRNFFPPLARWQFMGLRLAEDA